MNKQVTLLFFCILSNAITQVAASDAPGAGVIPLNDLETQLSEIKKKLPKKPAEGYPIAKIKNYTSDINDLTSYIISDQPRQIQISISYIEEAINLLREEQSESNCQRTLGLLGSAMNHSGVVQDTCRNALSQKKLLDTEQKDNLRLFIELHNTLRGWNS